MVLESLEYVSEDGGMTVLGDVLKDTPHKFQEPVLVALELMKFGLLSGEPFDPAQGQVRGSFFQITRNGEEWRRTITIVIWGKN